MQDIDFDEIDRAVNSHNNPNSNAKPVARTFVEPRPVTSTPIQTPAPTPVSSPAVRRSSGRFMDVVHPSSDMRPTLLTRPSVSTTPVPAVAAEPQRQEMTTRQQAVEEVTSRPDPVTVSSAAFHWPDPIDSLDEIPTATVTAPDPIDDLIETLEPSVQEPVAEVVEEPAVTDEVEDIDVDFEDEDEEAAPLESPFLTDAKVEKRPLGAFSGADADLPLLEDPLPFHSTLTASPTPTSVPATIPTSVFTSSPELVAKEEPEVVELAHEEYEETPHELHEDLLKLEGHGVGEEDELLLEATNPPDPEPTPVVKIQEVPTGPTSITQQYTEQPSSTTVAPGSIYDTEAYHQPLTHTAKKRSGGLVAVWIAALVLVGGGVGAAIYFIVLPMLG